MRAKLAAVSLFTIVLLMLQVGCSSTPADDHPAQSSHDDASATEPTPDASSASTAPTTRPGPRSLPTIGGPGLDLEGSATECDDDPQETVLRIGADEWLALGDAFISGTLVALRVGWEPMVTSRGVPINSEHCSRARFLLDLELENVRTHSGVEQPDRVTVRITHNDQQLWQPRPNAEYGTSTVTWGEPDLDDELFPPGIELAVLVYQSAHKPQLRVRSAADPLFEVMDERLYPQVSFFSDPDEIHSCERIAVMWSEIAALEGMRIDEWMVRAQDVSVRPEDRERYRQQGLLGFQQDDPPWWLQAMAVCDVTSEEYESEMEMRNTPCPWDCDNIPAQPCDCECHADCGSEPDMYCVEGECISRHAWGF